MSRYSHSSSECFDGCPLKFKYNYVDKFKALPEKSNKWAAKGLAFHESVELYGNEINNLKDLEKKMAEKMIEHNVEESMNVVPSAPLFVEFHKQFVQPLLDAGWREHHEFEIVESVESYKFVGYIDLLLETDTDLYIMDYKTGTSIHASSYKGQLLLYAFLLGKMRGWTPEYTAQHTRIAIVGPFDKKAKLEKIDSFVFKVDFSYEDLMFEVGRKQALCSAIERTDFTTITPLSGKPSFACNFCPYSGKGPNESTGFLGCKNSIRMGYKADPETTIIRKR